MGSYRQEPGMPITGGERRSSSSYSGDPRFGRTSQKSRKGLLGLSNLGNTCFMNAALQCLSHTHGMQKYFRHCPHAFSSKAQGPRQKLLMAFAHWFEQDWGAGVSAPYHRPEDVLRAVQQLNPTFQGYAQQDSQEFLRCVLDNIHEELRREVKEEEDHSHSSSGPNGVSSEGRAPDRGAPERSSGNPAEFFAPGGKALQRSSSATQQIMQLCHGPDGNTDMGEIRLSGGAPDRPSGEANEPSGHSLGQSSQGGSESSKKTQRSRHESIVSELFEGREVSCVRCLQCNQISRTITGHYDVSVPIPAANEPASPLSADSSPVSLPATSPAHLSSVGLRSSSWSGVLGGLGNKVKSLFFDKGVTLNDCLRRYCAPEYLTGKEQYYCERCKRKNDCEKRILFKELPEILCIHLKRFRFDNAYGWFAGSKNSRVVTFPVTQLLDMAQFMEEPPSQPAEYRLIGLVQHIGSMGGGHYIAYCQHKRKPQDWYEFDDVQVNAVGPEQVERAEPYVLFYQRVPTRAAKFERQTFKKDMRDMQERINQYLMGLARCRPRSERGEEMQAQISEEIRNQGPALRNLYKSPAPELDLAFISKHWYVRLTTMSRPGPLDNKEYLCPHGRLGYSSAELAAEPFFPISKNLSSQLISLYGGGPEITSLENCPKCQAHILAYNLRKQAEYEMVTRYDTKDTGDGQGWYLVDVDWVESWKRYVKSEPVTNYWDMCTPGPIRNERLFQKEDPKQMRENLRLKTDYIGVNACVWWLFMHVHGGGPPVVRDDLDMYSQELAPETHLLPDELRPKEGDDFYMRTSREFVDECCGDEELYKRLYGKTTPEGSGDGKPETQGGEPPRGDTEIMDVDPPGPAEATDVRLEAGSQGSHPPAEPMEEALPLLGEGQEPSEAAAASHPPGDAETGSDVVMQPSAEETPSSPQRASELASQ